MIFSNLSNYNFTPIQERYLILTNFDKVNEYIY
jgi:hypothetical protein